MAITKWFHKRCEQRLLRPVDCKASYSPIEPAAPDKVQTAPAAASEADGGRDALEGGQGEEGGSRRSGHWTATRGTGRAWANAERNKSEEPDIDMKRRFLLSEECSLKNVKNVMWRKYLLEKMLN